MGTAIADSPRSSPGRVGRSYAAPANAKPLDVVATPAPYVDKSPETFGNALTPGRLTAILLERNFGYLQQWTDLADEAREKDPHLHSQLALREQSVVETEFVVRPGKGSNQKAARRAADAAGELLEHWQHRSDQGLERWLAEFVGGAYYGRSLHEILWQRDGRLMLPESLALVEGRRLSYACVPSDPDPWALRIWDQVGAVEPYFGTTYGVKVSDFRADKFLVNEPRVRGAQPAREGLFATVVWYWLFRTWSWRDLMALAEMIGRPPVIAYFAAGGAQANAQSVQLNGARNATQPEINAARKMVNALTGALRAVLPDTIRLEALDFKIPTAEPMQLLTSREIDRLQSKAINGVDSISDLKPGARASVEVQERASATFWRADCRGSARLLSTVFGFMTAANPDAFGADCPAPVVVPQIDPPTDVEAGRARVDGARAYGLAVSEQWVRAELGDVPKPAKNEDVMVWPVAAPAPAPSVAPATPPSKPVSNEPAAAPDATE